MTHDLRKYREAKEILPHINTILKIFSLTEKSLSYFKAYIPVQNVLAVIKLETHILKINKQRYEEIKDNKGQK